jgi:hypothetical protein
MKLGANRAQISQTVRLAAEISLYITTVHTIETSMFNKDSQALNSLSSMAYAQKPLTRAISLTSGERMYALPAHRVASYDLQKLKPRPEEAFVRSFVMFQDLLPYSRTATITSSKLQWGLTTGVNNCIT